MKMSPIWAAWSHRKHLVALHQRLERAHRIDLGDDDVRAESAGPHRDAAPDPAVARRRRTVLPASRTLVARMMPSIVDWPGAVAVVEEVLRCRASLTTIIGECERTVGLHGLQADHAGGRLLHAGDDVAELVAVGVWSTPITSAPSSIVSCGLWATSRLDVQ